MKQSYQRFVSQICNDDAFRVNYIEFFVSSLISCSNFENILTLETDHYDKPALTTLCNLSSTLFRNTKRIMTP